MEFVLLYERYSLTPPELNVWIGRWQVDAVWRELKVVVELDSRAAHDLPSRLEDDRQRDLELRAAGCTVLRYTWRQLRDEPELVIADLIRHGVSRHR